MDCITPSHETAIPHGESLDIYQLLAHPRSQLGLPVADVPSGKLNGPYLPRKHVLDVPEQNLDYLELQVTRAEKRPSLKRGRLVTNKAVDLDVNITLSEKARTLKRRRASVEGVIV
jgi:hypothetical protein